MNQLLCRHIPWLGIKLAPGWEEATAGITHKSCASVLTLFGDLCWYDSQPIIYNVPVNDKTLPVYKNIIENGIGLFHL